MPSCFRALTRHNHPANCTLLKKKSIHLLCRLVDMSAQAYTRMPHHRQSCSMFIIKRIIIPHLRLLCNQAQIIHHLLLWFNKWWKIVVMISLNPGFHHSIINYPLALTHLILQQEPIKLRITFMGAWYPTILCNFLLV